VIANPSSYCSEQTLLYAWSCQVTTAEMILAEDLTTTCNKLITDAYDVIQDVCRTDFVTDQPANEFNDNCQPLEWLAVGSGIFMIPGIFFHLKPSWSFKKTLRKPFN
jgi:hypothetical protein